MTRFQRALREAGGIVLCAVVFGFGYTALTGQGLFAEAEAPAEPGPAPTVIHLPEAQQLYESGDAVFVDSRHEFDYRMGHIPGAINIPLADADHRLNTLEELPRGKTIVVYCDGAECNSSFALAARMRDRGFPDVRVFFGGWNEWQAGALPSDGRIP